MSRDIFLSAIDPDPNQPRKYFDEEKLTELAQSIEANGLAVPILVRPVDDRFIVVHGERRFRAAKSLNWEQIPAEIRELDADEAAMLALVENVQRDDLTSIEEAKAYQAMLEEGMTQNDLGTQIGKSQSYIATKIRLLKLPEIVQAALDVGSITEGHAKQILRIAEPDRQSELCEKAIEERLSVNRLRLEVDATMLLFSKSCELKFGDLLKFIEATEKAGMMEYKLRAERQAGHILAAGKRWWNDEGMPWLAIWAMEDAPLATVWLLLSLEKDLWLEYGVGLEAPLALADVPENVFNQWFDEWKSEVETELIPSNIIQKANRYARANQA